MEVKAVYLKCSIIICPQNLCSHDHIFQITNICVFNIDQNNRVCVCVCVVIIPLVVSVQYHLVNSSTEGILACQQSLSVCLSVTHSHVDTHFLCHTHTQHHVSCDCRAVLFSGGEKEKCSVVDVTAVSQSFFLLSTLLSLSLTYTLHQFLL